MKLRTKSETQALRQRVAKIQEQRGGVSVADLAKDAGVAYSVLYYLLNGVKKRMQAANYDQIVAWLERVETPSPPNAVDADLDLRAELASFKAKLARHYKVSPEEVTISFSFR
jgi:predicted transcriptional regulator